MRSTNVMAAVLLATLAPAAPAPSAEPVEYLLLATRKTSTLEKELNEAAESGFRFRAVMGGETAFGGKETVAIVARGGAEPGSRYEYKLLATNKTSTMQKELSEAAEEGYAYVGQTVTETLFGGREVIVIAERPSGESAPRFAYRLLATSKTSTMQRELGEAAEAGYLFKDVSVGATAFGGNEVVVFVERALDDPE